MDNNEKVRNENVDMAAEAEEGTEERPDPLDTADAKTLANAIAHFLDGKRARDIKIVSMAGKTDICDYMVLATGTSSTHVQSLGGEVEFQMSRRAVEPLHVEGRDNKSWVVLDYTRVLVHIFTKETREFYNLDKLYGD
jgi:ribosome-associated protein